MTSIEQKILICAMELDTDSSQQKKLRQLMSQNRGGLNVERLIHTAVKEGLSGLLYKSLMKSGALETVEQNQRESLQSFYYRTVLLNQKLIQDLKDVLFLLNQEGIHVVLLQGIALLHELYDDIGLRPMTDIDLWVLKKDYDGLVNILSSEGYQRDPVYPNTFRKGTTIFDFHTHILWADRIMAYSLILDKDQDCIYRDTRVINFEGQEVRCLSKADQVLCLGLHALKHYMEKLIWLVDIKKFITGWKGRDWAVFMKRAKELGQEKAISYIFFLFHLFDISLPVEARKLLDRKKLHFFEKKVLRDRIKKDSLPVWSPPLLFSSGKGLQRRFSLVLETLFPRPAILRQVFEGSRDQKVWKLYCKRVLQLLGLIKRQTH